MSSGELILGGFDIVFGLSRNVIGVGVGVGVCHRKPTHLHRMGGLGHAVIIVQR